MFGETKGEDEEEDLEDSMREAFGEFDVNGKGKITEAEMREMMKNLGLKDDEIKQMINSIKGINISHISTQSKISRSVTYRHNQRYQDQSHIDTIKGISISDISTHSKVSRSVAYRHNQRYQDQSHINTI